MDSKFFRDHLQEMIGGVEEHVTRNFDEKIVRNEQTYRYSLNGKDFCFYTEKSIEGEEEYSNTLVYFNSKEIHQEKTISNFKVLYLFYRFLQWAMDEIEIQFFTFKKKHHGDNNAN